MNKRRKIKTQLCRVLIELTIWRGQREKNIIKNITEKLLSISPTTDYEHSRAYSVACPWVYIQGHARLHINKAWKDNNHTN